MESASAPGSDTVIRHRSLPESVHAILRSRILNNELRPGTALVEVPLAAEFGVSRTTIRAAFRELQAERLVEIHPRRQTIVTRMSAVEIGETCYARYVLESAALPEVWPAVSATLAGELAEMVAVMQQAADRHELAGVVAADIELHRLVVVAGGHPRLIELWSTLNGQMGALMRSSLERQGIGLGETVSRHRTLVTAFESPDVAVARAALHEHYLDPATHG